MMGADFMYNFLKAKTQTRKRNAKTELAAWSARSCGLSRSRRVYNEFVGQRGIDATRYGDWEYAGRCTDFS